MKRRLVFVSILLAAASVALATDQFPDVIQVLPVAARAGQKIPNFKIVGTHFENFKSVEFRKSSGVDKLIHMTKVIKRDPTYVVVEVDIAEQLKGKRVVVVKTSVGASLITASADNTFEIMPALAKAPDLKVSQIGWGTGKDNFVRAYVQNAGGEPAKNFKVDMYLNGVKTEVYTHASTLPAGATMSFETLTLKLPKTKGTNVVKAVADSTNKIEEISETNNTREVTFDEPADEFVIPTSGYASNTLVRDKMAPNFTLKDWRSKPFTFYDNRGKPVLIVIGAMWSSYTQAETAALKKIYTDYQPKGLVVVQVLYDDLDSATSADPAPELLKAWVDGNQLLFPVLGDVYYSNRGYSVYTLYHSFYQPMNYIIAKNGSVYQLIEGFYEGAIRGALDVVTAQ